MLVVHVVLIRWVVKDPMWVGRRLYRLLLVPLLCRFLLFHYKGVFEKRERVLWEMMEDKQGDRVHARACRLHLFLRGAQDVGIVRRVLVADARLLVEMCPAEEPMIKAL